MARNGSYQNISLALLLLFCVALPAGEYSPIFKHLAVILLILSFFIYLKHIRNYEARKRSRYAKQKKTTCS